MSTKWKWWRAPDIGPYGYRIGRDSQSSVMLRVWRGGENLPEIIVSALNREDRVKEVARYCAENIETEWGAKILGILCDCSPEEAQTAYYLNKISR